MTLMQRTAADDVLGRVFGVLREPDARRGRRRLARDPGDPRGARPEDDIRRRAACFLRCGRADVARASTEIDARRASPASRSSCCARSRSSRRCRRRCSSGSRRSPPRCASPASVGVRAGRAGDRFYVIADGARRSRSTAPQTTGLGPGDFFGEIALLRDVPRTATVRAVDDLHLYALERDDFIAAVTGHAPSREAADSVVASRFPAVRRDLAAIFGGARHPLRSWSYRSARAHPRHRLGPRRLGCGRSAPRARHRRAATDDAELVLLCVPDTAIAEVGPRSDPGPWVAHVSGATPLAALEPHERRFSVHPLQTFTRSRGPEQLDGAWAAVTAETDEARAHGLVARRDARPAAVRARRLGAHALPRRRGLRLELPRHAAARGLAPLRGGGRAAGGARAADARGRSRTASS